jgi:hypothetical protein
VPSVYTNSENAIAPGLDAKGWGPLFFGSELSGFVAGLHPDCDCLVANP